MRQTLTLIMVVYICAVVRFVHADVLTIGSAAPKFSPEKFVLGTPIAALQRGQRYVIEFSGTTCSPCIQFIPLIEDLKTKHKQFTFISVFREPEADVRRFLKGAGAKMSTQVACDSTGAVDQLWMQAAGVRGIPFVFVVNQDLEIAWMGSPTKLATVLPILAKEKTVPPNEYMLVTLMQHAALRRMQANERVNEGLKLGARLASPAQIRRWPHRQFVLSQTRSPPRTRIHPQILVGKPFHFPLCRTPVRGVQIA